MKTLYTIKNTEEMFTLVKRLYTIEQLEKRHPEGNALQHTLQVVDWAFRESKDLDLIEAALLHDVGKYFSRKGHAIIGAEEIEDLVSYKTCWLVRNHMNIMYYLEGQIQKTPEIDPLINHPYFTAGVQLYRWDKLGRNKNVHLIYNNIELINKLNNKVVRN